MNQNKYLRISEKDIHMTSELLTEVYIAIVKGTHFLATIPENKFSDFVDVCQRIGTVQYLINKRMNMFLEDNKIEPLLVADTERNMNDFFERHSTRINKYLSYVETFMNGKKPEPQIKQSMKSEGILSYCLSCGHEYSCFIMFADEFLPLFKFDYQCRKDLIALKIGDLYNDIHSQIDKILDFYYIADEKNNIFGWPSTLDPKKKEYDAYASACVMDYVLTNKIESEIIRSTSTDFIDKIASSIINSQILEDQVEKKLNGVNRNIFGAWRNIYWEQTVGQIDVTVDILKVLEKHAECFGEEVQELYKHAKKNVKKFLEKAFKEKIDFYTGEYPQTESGWHPFVIDFPPHEDWFNIRISDVTGTIAALEGLLMYDDYRSSSPKILQIISWLLVVKTSRGAWPVLSKKAHEEAKSTPAKKALIFSSDDPDNPLANSYDIPSLSNTARAVKALNAWLEKLFETAGDPEIEKFEHTLRDFISDKMQIVYGDHWWRKIPEPVQQIAQKREENERKEGIEPCSNIDYLDILHYRTIMSSDDNYRCIFKAYFPDKDILSSNIKEINMLRRKVQHFHKNIPINYVERRDVYLNKIYNYLKKDTINNEWKNQLAQLLSTYVEEINLEETSPAVDIIEQLLNIRAQFRQNEDLGKADSVRDELKKLSIKIIDKNKNKYSWEMKP